MPVPLPISNNAPEMIDRYVRGTFNRMGVTELRAMHRALIILTTGLDSEDFDRRITTEIERRTPAA